MTVCLPASRCRPTPAETPLPCIIKQNLREMCRQNSEECFFSIFLNNHEAAFFVGDTVKKVKTEREERWTILSQFYLGSGGVTSCVIPINPVLIWCLFGECV